jgi:uncharacterized protein YndB with AHSA1/START domain
MTSSTDRIEKNVFLAAPRSRVWRALTDAKEFGEWFGVKMESAFVAGTPARGEVTYKGEVFPMEIVVDRIEPERLFSYRWHPAAIDSNVDYTPEPMTLVEFLLEEKDGGTQLTVVESGFDGIPLSRRQTALRMNTGGWAAQLENIAKYVG